jgi:hypothetical protein
MLEVMNLAGVSALNNFLPLAWQQALQSSQDISISDWILKSTASDGLPALWHRSRSVYVRVQIERHVCYSSRVMIGLRCQRGLFHRLDDVLDDIVRLNAFGLTFEVEDQPVPQDRLGHGLQVFAGHMIAMVEDGADLGTEY